MEKKNQFKTISEGAIKLMAPENYFIKGPGTKTAGFYNMDQKLNRDITISFLKTVKPKLALDAFGGTGVRGLRINREAGINTVISEINKKSFDYIKINKEINNSNVEIYNKTFQAILNDYLFDYIDIDPYGSVLPYLDEAMINLRNRGYIGVTATDLTALTGSMPAKTLRRYRAHIINDIYRHESGIRLLISEIVKRAAAMDKAAIPVISLWHSHYYRVIFQLVSSAGKADEQLEKTGIFDRQVGLANEYKSTIEGPLWLGNLNSDLISKLNYMDNPDKLFLKTIEKVKLNDLSTYFADIADFARITNQDTKAVEASMEKLRENGINCGRSQFSDTGIKVSSSVSEALHIIY
ncbi:N2,N2-dimethylguanosine tRNA methyltransferase [Ferroplasma sp.]|uniref:N2,N2-dimethylguanosine tRNA methyltransferase n=1 Tax=Ferroplasma sp. TaxID=2591003 RepID=UPI00307EC984